MDGTGDLFKWFVEALPAGMDATAVRYPADVELSYEQLGDVARQAFPATEPFVIVAESFSTPLAIQCASANPTNLRGLILCAGFAASPIIGWKRVIASAVAPTFLSVAPPVSAIKMLLVGWSAGPLLIQAVRSSISSVRSGVLVQRVRTILESDERAELAQIVMPILYLRPLQDKLVPARCMEEILRSTTNAKAVSVPGPHFLLQREPLRAAKAVVNFLRQLENSPKET